MKITRSLMNTYNRQEIINLIRKNPGIYCAQIARLTGLSIPAVMNITDQFVAQKIVRKVGKIEIRKGKHPEAFEFVSDAFYLIGVDVGTTNITAALLNLDAQIIYKYCIRTSQIRTPDEIFSQINEVIDNVYQYSLFYHYQLMGIGIGLAGIIDAKNKRVVFSPAFGWHNISIVDYLNPPKDIPYVVENVTKAMALAEQWFGKAREVDNMFCVNLGYGIGSALLIDGRIYVGDNSASGELGHMVIDENGPQCDCGNFGCLEALASANAIAKAAQAQLSFHPESSLCAVMAQKKTLEAKDVFDAAKQEDAFSLSLVDLAAHYIGMALANTVNLMDINLIILEGGMAQAGPFFRDKIKQHLRSHVIHFTEGKVHITISDLGSNAVCIGSATILLKEFIENGANTEIPLNLYEKMND